MNDQTNEYLPTINDCVTTIIDALRFGDIENLDEMNSIDDVSLAEIFIVPDDDDVDIRYPDPIVDMPELKSRIHAAMREIRRIKDMI